MKLARDIRLIENYHKVKGIVEKNFILRWMKDSRSQEVIREKLESCKLYESNSDGRSLAYYSPSRNIIVVGKKGQGLKDQYQMELLIHEIAHLLQFSIYRGSKPHGKEFKHLCILLGYPRVGKASSKLSKEMFIDTSYYTKASKEVSYKYEVKCSSCKKTVKYYKRVGSVIKNLSKYRSTCCKSTLYLEEVEK